MAVEIDVSTVSFASFAENLRHGEVVALYRPISDGARTTWRLWQGSWPREPA